ncbi:MAG TPA: hypothetical protein VGM22_10775 [Methylomirabilota bacterium]
MRRAALALLLALLVAGCATPARLEGVAGPLAWRAIELRKRQDRVDRLPTYDSTLVLTETSGQSLTFTTYERNIGPGHRGAEERVVQWPLPPHCQLWFMLSSVGDEAPDWRLRLGGTGSRGEPIEVAIQVLLPEDPAAPAGPAKPDGTPSADLADVPLRDRQGLQILTDRVSRRLLDVDPLLLFRDLRLTATLFGTAVRFGPGIPGAVQRHLRNFAAGIQEGLKGRSAVVSLALDLQPVGGDRAVFRFVFLEGLEQAGRCRREILITRLAPAPGADPAGPAAPADARLDGGWSDGERALLHTALSRLPNAARPAIADVKFVRTSATPRPANAAGQYNPRSHTILLYDSAFERSWTRFGSAAGRITDTAFMSIVHEVGHALDRPVLQSGRFSSATGGFRAAAARDGAVPITDYAGTDLVEHFAEAFALYVLDPQLLEQLRPAISAYFRELLPLD